MDRDAFISMMMPYAQQASLQTGLDPRLIIAQSALETGWGRSAPGMNYFGIKSHGRSGGQSLPTTEVYNGQPVGIIDSFRTYSNPGESVSDYVDFLRTNPRYEPLLAAEGLDAQLSALGASGYATDPQYESKLRSIAQGIEVGPMRTDELIANAGGAIDRAEAPSPLSRMANLFSTRSEPAARGGAGGMAYSSGGLVPGLMYLSGKAGEGLSRDQRRMLGFAALADAGAALSGRQGGQTQALMGQMQADQERERLRRQGLLQNLVAFEQALLPYRLSGMTPPPGIQSAYESALADFSSAGGGMPAAPPAGVSPAPAGGVSAPAPVAETPLPASGAVPTEPAPEMTIDEQIAQAQANIQRYSVSPATQGLARAEEGRLERLLAEKEARQQAVAQSEQEARDLRILSDSGVAVADYLIQGFDEQGNPVINPAIDTRAGRFIQSALETKGYTDFVKSITTIKETLAFEKLKEIKESGGTLGALSEAEREALAVTAGSLDPSDPIGTLRTLRRLEEQYGLDFGLSAPSAGSSGQVGGLTFTEID